MLPETIPQDKEEVLTFSGNGPILVLQNILANLENDELADPWTVRDVKLYIEGALDALGEEVE